MVKTLPLTLFLLGIVVPGFCQEYRIQPVNADFSSWELAYPETKNPVSIHLFVNELMELRTPIYFKNNKQNQQRKKNNRHGY